MCPYMMCIELVKLKKSGRLEIPSASEPLSNVHTVALVCKEKSGFLGVPQNASQECTIVAFKYIICPFPVHLNCYAFERCSWKSLIQEIFLTVNLPNPK